MSNKVPASDKCFIDSNVWLYALNQAQDARKYEIANQLVRATGFIVSTQVINEVCRNLRRKAAFSKNQIVGVINAFYSRCSVIQFDKNILLNAVGIRKQYPISFWDSLIVTSALMSEAELLYSEDMQNGLLINKTLVIVNPFE